MLKRTRENIREVLDLNGLRDMISFKDSCRRKKLVTAVLDEAAGPEAGSRDQCENQQQYAKE